MREEDLSVGNEYALGKLSTVRCRILAIGESNVTIDIWDGARTAHVIVPIKIFLADWQLPEKEEKSLWEILVPTVRPKEEGDTESRYFRRKFHKVWDAKVREISGGLTIMGPVKGQWLSPDQELFQERMIPVRIVASKSEINQIIDLTLNYYNQQAVMCYKISDEVVIKYR